MPNVPKTIQYADRIFSEVRKRVREEKQEFFITPAWVQGQFGVSRTTADGILARLDILAREEGLFTEKVRTGLRINPTPLTVQNLKVPTPAGKKVTVYACLCGQEFMLKDLLLKHMENCPKR